MPAFVNELVQQKVDVIVAVNNVVIRAAKEATKTIPIVMISSVDPVAAGYVDELRASQAEYYWTCTIARDLSAKRVELLKELLPKMSRVAVLWDADGPGPAIAFKEYEAAARAFKLELRSLEVRGPNPDFAGAFQAAKTARVEALIVSRKSTDVSTHETKFSSSHEKSPAVNDRGRSICRCWWLNVLRSELSRFIPARRRVRCRHSEGG